MNEYKSVSYSISPSSGASISGNTFTPTSAGTYTVTATVTYNAKGFPDATATATKTATITVTTPSCDYYTHVMWRDFGGTTYTPDETYGSVQRNTGTEPTADIGSLATSNTFDGWYVGDNGNATSTTGLTKYPDSSTYTNSSISIAYNTSVKHYYAFLTRPEPSYSVTVAKGAGGNVASTSVTAHPSTKVTLPTATPSAGYRFKNWTATTGITITNADSASAAQITATGTGTVTANFEAIPGTTIYIKKSMATFTHFYAWNGANTTAVTAAWPGDKFTSWSTTTDGKYYYKTYTWNCSTFKFILNNGGDSSKTTDSAAYDTGEAYYIDTATAGSAAVLNEGVPSAKAITYTSTYASSSDVTWGGTKPATAYPGEEVSFTVSAKSGYKITGVKYNDGTDHTITATSGTYKFTMPSSAVTVTATTVKQYTVTLTAGTGFATKKYKVGSGTQQTYSSAITVDEGSNVVFDVTYTTGYEYDSANSTLNGAVASNSNKTFTLSNVTSNKTVTLAAKKITWSGLTAVGKYSTTAANDASYSNDFPAGEAPNITIAAASATQLDGVAVSAPATDPKGYFFAGWYTANGTFENAANKDTTFKPNAANAVAIAKYKKIFKITYSVDDTGTGAGTVSTNVASVVAGGSYTITATAASHSAVESVKVNGTAKTATASQTISPVSADQTVVVKFKSNVTIRGNSTIGTNWDSGDQMTSNAAGTEFTKAYTNVAGSSSGTSYEFKLYNGTSYSDDSSATVTITGGASTGTMTTKAAAGVNWKLTLKKAANVTIKSDGTKITEIKVVPADATKYKVTFKKAANTTITGTYEGTNFTTASADAEVQVYSGDEISFTVTAASGYHIDSLTSGTTPAFSPAVTKEYKLSNVTAAKTVTPTAKADVNITAKTNKSSRGTVSVDKTKSFKGDTVKITVIPLAGTLKTLTASYANGDTYEWKSGNTWDKVKAGTSASNALLGAFLSSAKDKFALAPTGAETDEAAIAALPDLAPVGAAQTIDMEMKEDSAVTINAVFDTYSAESNYYYNGYDTSGNALSGYTKKQMTEVMLEGVPYSYYEVSGRSGADQLMTVSNRVPSSGTRYVYFVRPNNYGDGWSASNNPKAHFWKNGGQDYDTWPGTEMTWQWNNDYGQGVYKIAIPDGADRVSFNDATNNGQHQTVDIDLTTTSGAYYVGEWNSTYSKYDYGTWDTGWADQGWVESGTEYFYDGEIYTADFSTKGFHNHNTAGKEFAKPKELGTNTGDYYINVLYPNTTYTINGVTKKTGTNPMIIWSAEPLAGDDENVTVYAKDGAIRGETFGSTYANIADTKIYAANGTTTVGTKRNGSITNQTYETYKAAKGDTIVIKTTIGATDTGNLSNADNLKAKYYVRGFCINGEVPELLEKNDTGVYTLTYKVPEDFEGKSIEITPIYYLKDTEANPIVTYRVTGFTDELKAVGAGKPGWGDTLYTYPYYGKLGGDSNAFGAYPGQPMVYYKGQYQMQIPQKSTTWVNNTSSNTTVSGVTMSNGYWDSVHKSIMGYGDNSTSADHVQTYDYGDFYKIFNEKKPVDNIVFDFKYRTKKHNLVNDKAGSSIAASSLTSDYGTNGNGFEMLTNFHGKNVDLFGTPLSGDAADPSKTTPIYVVSIGGVNDNISGVENIAGYYATEWRVYAPNTPTSLSSTYKKVTVGSGNTAKSSIPPEVLVLNDDDTTSFNNTTYPSADANHNVTDWKAMYTALKQYAGHPVMISYEAADAQQSQGMYYTGTGGATRNDGRWLYSKTGENITSNIRIDVSHDSGSTYTENPASGVSGHVDGLSAYFTNADAYQKMTYATTIDPDKTFDFEAKTTNASYKFVGWYMADGTKITSDNVSHTERSGSYTFVARFMEVSSGQLTLSHSVDTGAEVEVAGHYYTCDGSGTAKIGAVVTDAETNEVLRTFDLSSSDITIPEKYIGNDKNYNITVTLEATADTNTAYGTSKLANTDESSVTEARFFNPKTPTSSGKTTTYTFTFNVKDDLYSGTNQRALALTYHSYFIQYKFNYAINYTFNDRNGKTKQYKRIGTLTPGEANTYVKKVDSNRFLDKSFIEKMAPYESNFGQDITWNFDDYQISNAGEDGSNYEYSINAHYTATQSDLNKRNITFALPYQHNNGVAVMTADGVGTKATTTNLEFIEVKDSEGTVTADNRVDFNMIPVLPNSGENGIFTEEGKKNWIAAPATITDGSATYNFQYWSVKPTDRSGANDPDVARCYFQGFNFVAYDNYIITPVYGESTVEPSEIGRNTNITYVETTRNQWNSNGTDYPKTQTSYAADLLYNDFIIAYNYNGKDIYNGEANGDIAELGVVVERIKKLEIKDDGSYDTTLSRYTDIAPNVEGVDAAIASATDINLSGKNSISKHAIDPTSLDNKNRIQFYNGIYNSAGWVQNSEGGQPEQNYAYKNYVYRAYSYMKLKDGTVIKSAVPAYFTMYDVATADLNNSN
ncbi:hypothetical protein [uncultured Ruminococcus sp.]|uniref:InlB B-repeat-containing protein n=1 Tax=uncultured Ruminococcus sp. TaxID=165186 RepID=UPI00292FF741|nr:hypothetical protein [uncultured Ruminococcus sp.]